MCRKIFICLFVSFVILKVFVMGESMLGPGVWNVLNIETCPDEDKYAYKFGIERKRINRTHDGFNGKIDLENPIDETFAIRVEICKYVDGGCKDYQLLTDECFPCFVNKYAEANAKKVFEMAEMDPPEFPVQKGSYEVNDYLFDYSELPEDGIYGKFRALAYLIRFGEDVGCVAIEIEFVEVEEE